MAVPSVTTRAYAPHQQTWQRFHAHAAPLASSSGAGSAAAASASHNPYARQYSHVYSARLALLRDRCLRNAKASMEEEGLCQAGEEVDVAEKIIEVKEGAWSILVGTIVKEVDPKRRPPVETAYGAASDAEAFLFPNKDGKRQESLRSFLFDAEKGDVLHLEDESGRVELAPAQEGSPAKHALDPNAVATGAVAAVVGKVDAAKGIMTVRSVHFAGAPATDGAPPSKGELRGATSGEATDDDEPALLLVSGLACGGDAPTDAATGASVALRREMLLDYLTDPSTTGKSVCRVIVAGGGIASPAAPKTEEANEPTAKGGKKGSTFHDAKAVKKHRADATAAALRELDLYLSEILASGIPVEYVPGRHDPTNANWPQRPLHSCLLPLSCEFVDLFGRSTNPYEGAMGGTDEEAGAGVAVLGSDGLNVADLRRFLAKKSAPTEEKGGEEGGEVAARAASCMDALHHTLRYGHVAPTGPDSLPTFPSSETDPFVLRRRPDVYFAGNCDAFAARLVDAAGDVVEEDVSLEEKRATRLVCVPSFATTGEAVLVKLRSLECEVVSFDDASL